MAGLRCLREVELELDSRRNYVFGPNGAGKTSLLEGIFVLGRGRSFRTRQTRRLVQHGAAGFAIFGEADIGGRIRRLGVAFDGGRLQKKIDGDETVGMSALAEALPVHVIDPSIHGLIEGGPSERRRFLDWGVFHVEHDYLDTWKKYRRVLSQRNAALKGRAERTELRTWDAALVESGEVIDIKRRAYIHKLSAAVDTLSRRLLDQPVALRYRAGWPEGRTLEVAVAEAQTEDRESGSTAIGPHRADVILELGGRRVQDDASRGQQKLAAAALVLAQVALLGTDSEASNVLLLDDPAAELDSRSLQRLLEVLADLSAQVVFTGLSSCQLPPEPGFPVFHVERGQVRAL